MARRASGRARGVSPLRAALAARTRAFAEAWQLTGTARRRHEDAAAVFEAGAPVVLDAVALCLGLSDAGDPRWSQYRHDHDRDPGERRRWLLTETDAILGPLTPAQMTQLAKARGLTRGRSA